MFGSRNLDLAGWPVTLLPLGLAVALLGALAPSKKGRVVVERAPNGKALKVVKFDGWKRISKAPPEAVAASKQAIVDMQAQLDSGVSRETFPGTVYREEPTWMIVYEEHYWPEKGVHLGATVLGRKAA